MNISTEDRNSLEIIRLIICGSVNSGKSKLVESIFCSSSMILDDHLTLPNRGTKTSTALKSEVGSSLYAENLIFKDEQDASMNLACHFFSNNQRRFISVDIPDNDQYTRNIVVTASTADIAAIVIDANQGITTQTCHHSIICSMLSVKKILLIINKIDLIDYSKKIYEEIESNYRNFANNLNFESITSIPTSALRGDNIVVRSKKTQWFQGTTLLDYLETINIQPFRNEKPFRLIVQKVHDSNSNLNCSGTIEAGQIKIGQKVRILPAGTVSKIKKISTHKDEPYQTKDGQAITLTLNNKVAISRGSVIAAADSPPEVSDQFEIELIWINAEPGYIGRSYLMKLGTSTIKAQITDIKYRINVNTFERLSAKKLSMNDINVVTIKTDQPIVYEKYKDCPGLGGLILIDHINHQTVGVGMINFALRRAHNVHMHQLDIDKAARQSLNGHISKVLWFTGLSGSGKSTIANALEKELHSRNICTYILDGDNIRQGLNKDLGFTDADRVENIRRISEVARLMVDAGVVVLTAFISPFRAERKMARDLFSDGEFIEIFVDTPLEIAESRDPKGLYKKARKGELPNFTGIDSPYEKPLNPDIKVSTEKDEIDIIVDQLIINIGF